jgi:predicted nucleic acid-binding protein
LSGRRAKKPIHDGSQKNELNGYKLSYNVEQVLNSLPILPLEESVDKVYAEIRVNLEGRGLPIGQHDLLIAAHGLCH